MRIAAFASAALLTACAGAAPSPTHYLLRADSAGPTGRVEAPVRVALGRVAVAPYLEQSGVVVETAAGQVRAASQHQWAEPLADGLRSQLRAEISRELGYDVSARRDASSPWDYVVDVYVDRLHGTMSGTAVLDASFAITPRAGGGGVVGYRFSRVTTLPREGYPALVEAEASLVRELAASIAAALREPGAH